MCSPKSKMSAIFASGSTRDEQAMVTPTQVRKVALSLPQAEEHEHHDHPDFRVNGKIFATLWPGESRAVVKLAPADQGALLQMDPEAFSLNAWSHQGWTNVHFEHIELSRLRKVFEAAWRNVAPKKLVASIDRER